MNKVLRLDENAFVTTRHFDLFLKKSEELADPDHQKKFLTNLGGGPRSFVYLDQVHGSRVAVVDTAREPFTRLAETDAVITNLKDLGLIVMTADCLSIFFDAGDWVGLAHAGWRGTRAGIGRKTFEALVQHSGRDPKDVKIHFGPCIRDCHYEVGPEFKTYFPSRSLQEHKGKLFFDLPLENKRQLMEAGAFETRIDDTQVCTARDNKDFYSYRLEGASAGRMLSIIWRR